MSYYVKYLSAPPGGYVDIKHEIILNKNVWKINKKRVQQDLYHKILGRMIVSTKCSFVHQSLTQYK